jgi:hypothetical protein
MKPGRVFRCGARGGKSMSVTAPDWLTRRGGALQADSDGYSWVMLFEGRPQYLLIPRPAGGKYACEIMQTNNAQRLGNSDLHSSAAEALQGGLETLRQALGWGRTP